MSTALFFQAAGHQIEHEPPQEALLLAETGEVERLTGEYHVEHERVDIEELRQIDVDDRGDVVARTDEHVRIQLVEHDIVTGNQVKRLTADLDVKLAGHDVDDFEYAGVHMQRRTGDRADRGRDGAADELDTNIEHSALPSCSCHIKSGTGRGDGSDHQTNCWSFTVSLPSQNVRKMLEAS